MFWVCSRFCSAAISFCMMIAGICCICPKFWKVICTVCCLPLQVHSCSSWFSASFCPVYVHCICGFCAVVFVVYFYPLVCCVGVRVVCVFYLVSV